MQSVPVYSVIRWWVCWWAVFSGAFWAIKRAGYRYCLAVLSFIHCQYCQRFCYRHVLVRGAEVCFRVWFGWRAGCQESRWWAKPWKKKSGGWEPPSWPRLASLAQWLAGVTTILLNNWRVSYFIGGSMGLCFFMRIGVLESGMFDNLKKEKQVSRGNFFYLFSHPKLYLKYLNIILVAVPVWFAMFFSFSLPQNDLRSGPFWWAKGGKIPIMVAYIGITIGDVASGLLSQKFQSRRRVLFIFISLTFLFSVIYYLFAAVSVFVLRDCFLPWLCNRLLGGVYEQCIRTFGTNIRQPLQPPHPIL